MTSGHLWMSLLAVLVLGLTSASSKHFENGLKNETSTFSIMDSRTLCPPEKKNLQAYQGEPAPQNELKFNVHKLTWTDAKLACAASGASLYTFNNSAQLNLAMIDFSPLHSPWVDMKKTGVLNSSMLCGFLKTSKSGRSILHLDNCHARHDFICLKKTSKNFIAQILNTDKKIAPRADFPFVEIAEILQNFVTMNQFYLELTQPILANALTQTNVLDSEQLDQLQSIAELHQTLMNESLPSLIAEMTPATCVYENGILNVQVLLISGIEIQDLAIMASTTYLPLLGISAPYQQVLIDFLTENENFFYIFLEIFYSTNNDPAITPENIQRLKNSIAAGQNLLILAGTLDATATTTPAPPPPPTPLQQVLAAILAQATVAAGFFGPLIDAANPATLTTTEAGQLEAIRTHIQNLLTVGLPNVIDMVVANPTLTPEQMQQVKQVLAQKITIMNAVANAITSMGDDLNLNAAQVAALQSLMGEVIALCTDLFKAVGDPNLQPTISTGLLGDILAMSGQITNVLGQVQGPLATTTTPPTLSTRPPHHTKPPHYVNPLPQTNPFLSPNPLPHTEPRPPTRPPQGGHHLHHLSQHGRHLVTSRIYAVIEALDALFNLLRSPALRTTTTQPVAVINQLLKLRTREAEIEAHLLTMPEQEQKKLANKLEIALGQLRKLVSDRSELDQYLKTTPESQLLITVFLNKMVDYLEPFL